MTKYLIIIILYSTISVVLTNVRDELITQYVSVLVKITSNICLQNPDEK